MRRRTLFDELVGKVVRLKTNNALIIIQQVGWYKGELDFDCLVPQEENGRIYFCNATYRERDVEFI